MSLPTEHAVTLDRILAAVADDPRFDGVAAGGSLLTGGVDEFSDLDLVIVVTDAHHVDVMAARPAIAAGWGHLLAAFTGEHVGEPRLLICLYDQPLMHVDLKFVTADELAARIEDPVVLWERGDAVTRRLGEGPAVPLSVDPQWIEERMWIWVHYAATKLGRGELFETLDFLAFLRATALAPLALHLRGLEPRGVRRAEILVPELVPALSATVARHDARECAVAIRRAVEVYRDLRDRLSQPLRRSSDAEAAAVEYLEATIARIEVAA